MPLQSTLAAYPSSSGRYSDARDLPVPPVEGKEDVEEAGEIVGDHGDNKVQPMLQSVMCARTKLLELDTNAVLAPIMIYVRGVTLSRAKFTLLITNSLSSHFQHVPAPKPLLVEEPPRPADGDKDSGDHHRMVAADGDKDVLLSKETTIQLPKSKPRLSREKN